MENKSLSKKFGAKKIKSLLKVFSNEWVWIYFQVFVFICISGLILIVISTTLIFVIKNFIKSQNYRILLWTGAVLGLFSGVCLSFAGWSFFGLLDLFYVNKKKKYSKLNKVLSVYNEIGKKYNLDFNELNFNKIYILPSCSDKQDISSPKNRNLDNKYTFTKNDKKYILVFEKITYASEFEEHDFYRKILLRAELYELINNQKIQLNLKETFKDSDLISSDERSIGDFELLGIKGVAISKTKYHYPLSSGMMYQNLIDEYENGVYSNNGLSWEGYTYWDKNMKQWRKDYLQESYRLPGVWCNNDVKVKDMDEYIEKKINFECQLINDIFDNFVLGEVNINDRVGWNDK